MDYGISGKHRLVTGGATGIGLAVLQACVAERAVATISGLNGADVDGECFRRMITPQEVARSVLHLAVSPYLNGMAMRAEGGTIRAVI